VARHPCDRAMPQVAIGTPQLAEDATGRGLDLSWTARNGATGPIFAGYQRTPYRIEPAQGDPVIVHVNLQKAIGLSLWVGTVAYFVTSRRDFFPVARRWGLALAVRRKRERQQLVWWMAYAPTLKRAAPIPGDQRPKEAASFNRP
jgi:hypothetical protein